MSLRISPAAPLLWRTPHEAQLGLEHPQVLLSELTAAQEHMLSALAKGTSRTGLTLIARAVGAPEADVDTLLDRIAPALEAAGPSPLVHVIDAAHDRAGAATAIAAGFRSAGFEAVVVDAADTLDGVTSGAEGSGADASAAGPSTSERSSLPWLVITIADYVLPPSWSGRWLRDDIAHLPIVFGAAAVRIGPLVVPGDGPCLYCIDRWRLDDEPAWPAFAGQLWGRPSPARTALTVAECTALVVRAAQTESRAGSASLGSGAGGVEGADAAESTGAAGVRLGEAGVVVTVDAANGRISEQRMSRHPQCQCATLAETDSATVTPIGAAPQLPTTIAANVARA